MVGRSCVVSRCLCDKNEALESKMGVPTRAIVIAGPRGSPLNGCHQTSVSQPQNRIVSRTTSTWATYNVILSVQ